MRILYIAVIIAALLSAQTAVLGQDAGPQTDGERGGLSPAQQEALKRGTALFIVTLILFLIMLVLVVAASITLRRRVAALEKQMRQLPTDAESLWWKTGGAGEDGKDRKE